jgi:hypothetical protein
MLVYGIYQWYTWGVLMVEQMNVDTEEDKKSIAGFR